MTRCKVIFPAGRIARGYHQPEQVRMADLWHIRDGLARVWLDPCELDGVPCPRGLGPYTVPAEWIDRAGEVPG